MYMYIVHVQCITYMYMYIPLSAGHGTCSCTECICDIEDNTGLSYQGEHCECDPLICYNEERDGVSTCTCTCTTLHGALRIHAIIIMCKNVWNKCFN